jgi:hypothetical protein
VRMRWNRLTCCILTFVTGATACGYRSEYVVPDQSRMRPVWTGRTFASVGADEIPICATSLDLRQTPDVILLRIDGVDDRVVGAPEPAIEPFDPDHAAVQAAAIEATVYGVARAVDLVAEATLAEEADDDGGGAAGSIALAGVGLAIAVASVAAATAALAASPVGHGPSHAARLDEINAFNDRLRSDPCGPWAVKGADR